MYGTDTSRTALSVRVALPTAAELLRAAETTGKPIELQAAATMPPAIADTSTAAGEESAEVAENVRNYAQNPVVNESIGPSAGDDTAERLERIHSTIGRLALLEYSSEQARDDEQRLRIFREMHSLAVPLVANLYPLIEDSDEDNGFSRMADEMFGSGSDDDEDEEPEDEPSEPHDGGGIARGFALRILEHPDPEVGCRWWSRNLLSPRVNVRKLVSRLAEEGVKARAFEVSVDLDMGRVKVKPLPMWTGSADDPDHADENEDSGTAPADDEPEQLGDQSTYLGGAAFERLPDQWTLWNVQVEQDAMPELAGACKTLEEAFHEAEKWKGSDDYDWATIIVGPGQGAIDVEDITLWPNMWTVKAAELFLEGSFLGRSGRPVDRATAIGTAGALAVPYGGQPTACPIITAPYRSSLKGGAQ